MKIIKVICFILSVGAGLFAVRLGLMAKKSQEMPALVSRSITQLDKCPDRPSCVSSTSSLDNPQHFISPLELNSFDIGRVEASIKSIGGQIVERKENYIHAIFESSLFGFVDDLELNWNGSQLHVRSLSRQGYSDLGANRKRVLLLFDNIKGG